MEINVNYSNLTEDRGVFNEYPKGTNAVHFVVKCPDLSAELKAVVYFTPDGQRRFLFYTDDLGASLLTFSAHETMLIGFFINWLSQNRDKIYPTGSQPTGLPSQTIPTTPNK
jgi:hypothetical protein